MADGDAQAIARERERFEAQFHDARVGEGDARRHLRYAYASVRDVYGFTNVPPDRLSSNVLEIGCFRGARAQALTAFSGRYTGIDISSASVDWCRRLGLASNFVFEVENANELARIKPQSVGYAFGDGVLHHLELERFVPALDRVLAPDGYARFIEPAQGNIALRAFRRLTPRLRTPDEHPFDDESLSLLRRSFDVRISYHGLLRPWIPMLAFNSRAVSRWTRRIDEALLDVPMLQRQAWLLLIELRRRPPVDVH